MLRRRVTSTKDSVFTVMTVSSLNMENALEDVEPTKFMSIESVSVLRVSPERAETALLRLFAPPTKSTVIFRKSVSASLLAIHSTMTAESALPNPSLLLTVDHASATPKTRSTTSRPTHAGQDVLPTKNGSTTDVSVLPDTAGGIKFAEFAPTMLTLARTNLPVIAKVRQPTTTLKKIFV